MPPFAARFAKLVQWGTVSTGLPEQKGNIIVFFMSPPFLSRKAYSPPPGINLVDGLTLTLSRCHEFCGPARRSLALMLAARLDGPVLWIRPDWTRAQIMAQGARDYIDPGRLIVVEPGRADDILWCMEESLRAGVVPMVVAECDAPPALTPIRRLHLAAETGSGVGSLKPLGLILTPGDGGAQGVESRWHLAPRHRSDTRSWLLHRRRARLAPPAAWVLTWQNGAAKATPVAHQVTQLSDRPTQLPQPARVSSNHRSAQA